jgi:hypothetical protein
VFILHHSLIFPYDLGTSATFPVEVDSDAQVALGYDPEEAQEELKMLKVLSALLSTTSQETVASG